jgi:hypothetical protein
VYWRPRGQHEGQKCPTLLYVYGGPHVQLVVNSYTLTVQFKRYQVELQLFTCTMTADSTHITDCAIQISCWRLKEWRA